MSFFLKWKLLQYFGHVNVSSVTGGGGASAKLTVRSKIGRDIFLYVVILVVLQLCWFELHRLKMF